MCYTIVMKITQSYGIKIKGCDDAIKRTIVIYNQAIQYIIPIIQTYWDDIHKLSYAKDKQMYVESLIHSTSKSKVTCDFDQKFYKFPSYLRRAAIMEAIGIWSSYMSQVDIWAADDCKGSMPKPDKDYHHMPCLYRKNMFNHIFGDTAQIKVFCNNDWVWKTIRLNHSDRRYLEKKAPLDKWSAPTLEKHHGHYELRFTREIEVELSDKEIFDQKVCAVDLGVTVDATCSVLDVHGTVLSRKFINCGREKDSVADALHRVSVFQRLHGPHNTGRLWNVAKRRNLNLAHLVARQIVDYAIANDCDVIVFEYLDTKDKKRGSKKQKLAMWKHADIQNTVTRLAHCYGIRIAHICAWKTSKLAYDGSGEVLRGKDVSNDTPYDMCKFANGKMYNCDLSASYNIGARYIIRELIKALPNIMTEVSDIGSGTTRTLSTLWHINATMVI